MVDDDGAARWQTHFARMGRLDLVFDLEAREQRYIIHIAFDAVHVVRHYRAHERVCLLVHLVGVDQDFADFRVEVVADRAHHQRAFQIDQGRGFFCFCRICNGSPELIQVVQVPLQLFFIAPDSGCACDDAHAIRYFQMREHFAQFGAFVTLDAA